MVVGSVVISAGVVTSSAGGAVEGRTDLAYKMDTDGAVCQAYDQSMDYSRCGRAEPVDMYPWARNKYGPLVEETCGSSQAFVDANPVPLSKGFLRAGNAWFVVCNYQMLAQMPAFCDGSFEAQPPLDDGTAAPPSSRGSRLPQVTLGDYSRGWVDPCAAHAFCSACDDGANPYCNAWMRQVVACEPDGDNFRIQRLYNTSTRDYFCSKLPEIEAGTYDPAAMSADQCHALFFA
mmetsp:Transcript_10378/g.26352  ORF Transcript_10378/g.26352 Transcript_10378/m.26352 type:complete len:233 (-) Transcript_10378:160-858(-)